MATTRVIMVISYIGSHRKACFKNGFTVFDEIVFDAPVWILKPLKTGGAEAFQQGTFSLTSTSIHFSTTLHLMTGGSIVWQARHHNQPACPFSTFLCHTPTPPPPPLPYHLSHSLHVMSSSALRLGEGHAVVCYGWTVFVAPEVTLCEALSLCDSFV